MGSPSRILVLRGGALGDFIVTLPALVAVRQHYPGAALELVGNGTAASLALHRRLLDRVHSQHEARFAALYSDEPLPTGLARWLARFDLVINYWPDPDGALARHFPVMSGQQFITAPAMPTQAPAAAHYATPLRALGIEVPYPYCRIRKDAICAPTPTDVAAAAPEAAPVAIHPGSGSPRKNWPRVRWLELIGRLATPVVMVFGHAEAETWTEASLRDAGLGPRLDDGSVRVVVGASLEQLLDVFDSCRLFLGHDSGVSHLAAASGKPCILLFGPTDPAVRAPPGAHVKVLRRGETLEAIAVDDVLAAMPHPAPAS